MNNPICKIFFFILIFILNKSILSKEKLTSPVEIILSSDNSIYENGLYSIQTVLETEFNVSYLDILLTDNSNLQSYLENLETKQVPLIITIGPQATKFAIENISNLPIVFAMVPNPKSLNIKNQNVCGLGMDLSIVEFFTTLKDINKNIKNVYAFYSTSEMNYQLGEGIYRDLEFKLNFNPMQVNNENFSSNLESLKGKAQAFYLISDPIYNQSRFEEISSFCKKNHIILMTSFPQLVKLGTTFGISPEYNKIGVEAGQMANRILSKNSTCNEENILIPTQSSFYINENYAQESGIKLSDAIIERAKHTKLFSAGVTLFNENKLNPAKIIFDSLLQKDPNNLTAQTYKSLIIEKLSGSRTRDLLKSAKQYFNAGEYVQARLDYGKVLSIDPNNEQAKEGNNLSTISLSEQEGNRGIAFFKTGNYFEAIKSYLSSLRTLPSNQKSLKELASLRNQVTSKIPEYLKLGIDQYNQRDYDKAIISFENILLIDPNEKTAKEYLRLSIKKKEAITILKQKLKNNS